MAAGIGRRPSFQYIASSSPGSSARRQTSWISDAVSNDAPRRRSITERTSQSAT